MTEILSELDRLGAWLCSWTVAMNVRCAVLLLAVMIVDYLLRQRVSARLRLPLYLLVIVRLLVPLQTPSPIALLPDAGFVGILTSTPALTTGAPSELGELALDRTSDSAWSLAVVAPLCYAGVVTALLGLWIRRRVRLSRQLRRIQPPPDRLAAMAPGARIFVHPSLGPATVGMLPPRIIMPEACVRQMTDEDLRAVIEHERAHIAHGDHLLWPAVQIVCTFAWPIAAVWVAARAIRQHMEFAADERAVGRIDSPPGRRYVSVLLAVARRHGALSGERGLTFVRDDLRQRLRSLRRIRRRLHPAAQIITIVAVGVTLLGCTLNREQTTDPGEINLTDITGPVVFLDIQLIGATERTLNGMPFIDSTWPENEVILITHVAHDDLLQRVSTSSESMMLSSPRVAVHAGKSAEISVGSGAEADVDDGLRFRLLPTLPADDDDTISLDFDYEHREGGEVVSQWQCKDLQLPVDRKAVVRLQAEHTGLPTVLIIGGTVKR